MALMSASSSSSEGDGDFVCLYLDDCCQEVEVVIDGEEDDQVSTAGCKRGNSSKGGSKRKRKMLNKDEKAKIMLSICDLNMEDVLAFVSESLGKENHITENSAKKDFWASLQSSGKQVVLNLLQTLTSLFATLYKSCDKGKDKYMKFQLEWHQNCSVFLLPPGKIYVMQALICKRTWISPIYSNVGLATAKEKVPVRRSGIQ